MPCCADEASGGGAVPAHFTPTPQLSERHPAPVVSEYAAKARSAAFCRMHLQEQRGPSTPPLTGGLALLAQFSLSLWPGRIRSEQPRA